MDKFGDVPALQSFVQITLYANKVCTSIQSTVTGISSEWGKSLKSHEKRIWASVCYKLWMDHSCMEIWLLVLPSVFFCWFLFAKVQTCQLLCCWTLGDLLQCSVSESDSSFDLATSCRSDIYQLLVWPYFAHPRSRNACLIHRWDFCNCNVLAFRKGFSRVLINDLGRIMGLCISSGNDPMFSSLPYAHKTPCLSDAGISFLSTVYTLIVC